MRYRRSHSFTVDPESLWAALEQVDQFERWWPWFQEVEVAGAPLARGTVLSGVVAPPLPYRMRLDVELTDCRRPVAIDARVRGDLRGPARLRLRPEADGTTVDVEWSMEMMQRPMRLASRLAGPLLQWGHDRIVDMTVAGFRRAVE